DDTFSQDTTGDGTATAGGGAIANTGSLTMEESTVTTSSATGNGASADTPGAIVFISGTATITGCTIANNTVGLNQSGGGTVTLTNDIIAENQIDLTSTGVQATYTGSYNVIGKDTTGTMTAGNHNNIVGANVNPGLGPMGYYGGHTLVYSLQTGSPAIDTGSNALVPIGINNDQRGNIRIVNGTVDIGSYEFGGPPLTNPPPLVVNTTNDGADYVQGILTLRQAITIANAQTTPQTITFDTTVFTAGTQHVITLVNGLELEISNTA